MCPFASNTIMVYLIFIGSKDDVGKIPCSSKRVITVFKIISLRDLTLLKYSYDSRFSIDLIENEKFDPLKSKLLYFRS